MGNDAALACLSKKPRLVYDYFRQLFAQVTNPPIDPIREGIVMSLVTYVGPRQNIFLRNAEQCSRLKLESPILTNQQLKSIKENTWDWKVEIIDMTMNLEDSLETAIHGVCEKSLKAVSESKAQIIILSDKAVGPVKIAIPALLALGAVHHSLINARKRSEVAIMLESGEPREVHHFCVLLGFGADAINPYLALEVGYTLAHLKNCDKKDSSTRACIKLYVECNFKISLELH